MPPYLPPVSGCLRREAPFPLSGGRSHPSTRGAMPDWAEAFLLGKPIPLLHSPPHVPPRSTMLTISCVIPAVQSSS